MLENKEIAMRKAHSAQSRRSYITEEILYVVINSFYLQLNSFSVYVFIAFLQFYDFSVTFLLKNVSRNFSGYLFPKNRFYS